jgi:hypothetical protein
MAFLEEGPHGKKCTTAMLSIISEGNFPKNSVGIPRLYYGSEQENLKGKFDFNLNRMCVIFTKFQNIFV